MSPLKRKAHLERLKPESLKRLRLDPMPISKDLTIMDYHQRIQRLLPDDRDKLHICIPFEKELGQVQAEIKSLRAEIQSLHQKDERAQAEIQSLHQRDERAQQKRLILFQTNALVDLARLISKKCKFESMDHSTTRLQQFVLGIDDAQLLELNIPRKIWPLLRKLDKFTAQRNSAAHETGGDFAQLLLSNEFINTHTFEVWKDVFPLLYGGSVQDLAAREEAEVVDLLALTK